ncbi:endonuclease/exonuclease/phosphatase family protein [Chitinophaga cymbidii]|uniref:Endonuclease n=1 Tax=Chitinophaga cymbidii TaxID=1096750 RepID=A0A512RHR0_9BACT|nr:endonuclease/exonuclease/phosphatase family protein [Chitinophaga cymbidii]GEP95235.1 endonuclease [Chitinophaga cymbidii]
MRFLRLFTKGFFLIVNIVTVLFFLLACLAPFISPVRFWPISFLTLGFPFMLVILLLFLIFWLVFHPRYALIPLLALLIGWKSVSAFIAFRWPSSWNTNDKPEGSFNVMSYNVALFGLYAQKNSRPTREAMFRLIKAQKPDILCLQDFYTSEKKDDFNNREDISEEMKLPHRFFSSDFNRQGSQHWGSIIFSRYPIIQSDKVKMSPGPMGESLIYADIVRNGDTLRIVNMHLESYRFNAQDYQSIEKIKKQEDTGLVAAKGIMNKMRDAYIRRSRQANIVADFIKTSPYPVIVCGDFNDTPASYTYFTVKGALQDAFLRKGSGIGRTFSGLSPTLRIDYIFADKRFSVNGFRTLHADLSDHYPVITNVTLRK